MVDGLWLRLHPSVMLFVPPILDLDGEGTWTRDQLEEMDRRFVTAVTRAFELGLESRAAAAATVSFRNGSQRLAEKAAIESAWRWFVDAKFQATAVEVLKFVRARSLSVTAERVRVEFRRRLFSQIGQARA
jgi:hypothetical protein